MMILAVILGPAKVWKKQNVLPRVAMMLDLTREIVRTCSLFNDLNRPPALSFAKQSRWNAV